MVGVGIAVVSAAARSKLVTQIFLTFLCVLMGTEEGIHTKAVIGTLFRASQESVDFVLGNKSFPFGVEPLCGSEDNRLSLKVTQTLQPLLRSVPSKT